MEELIAQLLKQSSQATLEMANEMTLRRKVLDERQDDFYGTRSTGASPEDVETRAKVMAAGRVEPWMAEGMTHGQYVDMMAKATQRTDTLRQGLDHVDNATARRNPAGQPMTILPADVASESDPAFQPRYSNASRMQPIPSDRSAAGKPLEVDPRMRDGRYFRGEGHVLPKAGYVPRDRSAVESQYGRYADAVERFGPEAAHAGIADQAEDPYKFARILAGQLAAQRQRVLGPDQGLPVDDLLLRGPSI
jgi:hypothetical protein